MGGLLLVKGTSPLLQAEAERVFERKGLASPRRFQLGDWRLILYRKLLLESESYVQVDDGTAVFACGTVVYRGLSLKPSLQRLLSDFKRNALDRERLQGSFCLVFWDGSRITVLPDRLDTQHMFTDATRTCLSSSFLALVAGSPVSLKVNRRAVLGKLAAGNILSPDTLVEGISQLNRAGWLELTAVTGLCTLPPLPQLDVSNPHRNGFADSIERQVDTLSGYFSGLSALNNEFRAEVGLSSGYDSRLILALTHGFSRPVPLHSHHTVNVHEQELDVARELAAVGGNELSVVSTTRPEEMDEERRRALIYDCLYLFDGRCLHDMGSFSETYTARYRINVMKNNRLSLNGLGGELYRNGYQTPLGRFAWDDWMDHAIFFPFAREACDNEESFHELRQYQTHRIAELLSADLSGSVDFHTTRRYYGLLRMPEHAANVSNAYNQVGFFLTPFIDWATISEALNASAYIGVGGRYEAAMIERLSPPLAAVRSQYGHNYCNIPWRKRIWYEVANRIPLRMRNIRLRRLCLDDTVNPDGARYQKMLRDSPAILEIEGALRQLVPGADWPKVMCTDAQKKCAVSVGSFLVEFQSKLKV